MTQPTLHQFIANCNDLDRIKRYSNFLNTLVTHENYKLVYSDYDENRKLSIDWLIKTRRTFEHFCNQDMPFTKHYKELINVNTESINPLDIARDYYKSQCHLFYKNFCKVK